jgi:hypothetical protein
MFRDHNVNWIWESAKRLADAKVRWIRTDGDRLYKGISSLFGAETETVILRFNFPPLLVPLLKDPRRFARLRKCDLACNQFRFSVLSVQPNLLQRLVTD